MAGHKGHPEAVKKRKAPRRRRLKGGRGRETLAEEKPPIFGMLPRGGEVVIRMLEDVEQVTIGPSIERTIAKGSLVYTDESNAKGSLVYTDESNRRRNSPAR